MHPFLWPALLTLVLRQTPTPASPRAPAACPDRQRLELSLRVSLTPTEICISPGVLTGFVFDQPASVDLQEEVRFGKVLRGRGGISFLPPPDLAPGERLRLTIHFEKDSPDQGVALMLVSAPGQVTHQVDVFHDARSRESLRQEIEEAWAQNQRLLEENQVLSARLNAPVSLLKLYQDGELDPWGVRSRTFSVEGPRVSPKSFKAAYVTTYRSNTSVGATIFVSNESDEPWTVAGVRMSGNRGEQLKNVDFSGSQTFPPHETGRLFVEAKVEIGNELNGLTVTLQGEREQFLTVDNISLP